MHTKSETPLGWGNHHWTYNLFRFVTFSSYRTLWNENQCPVSSHKQITLTIKHDSNSSGWTFNFITKKLHGLNKATPSRPSECHQFKKYYTEENNHNVFLSGGREAVLFKFPAYAPAVLEHSISNLRNSASWNIFYHPTDFLFLRNM